MACVSIQHRHYVGIPHFARLTSRAGNKQCLRISGKPTLGDGGPGGRNIDENVLG